MIVICKSPHDENSQPLPADDLEQSGLADEDAIERSGLSLFQE